jgi:hypothetical protein
MDHGLDLPLALLVAVLQSASHALPLALHRVHLLAHLTNHLVHQLALLLDQLVAALRRFVTTQSLLG